MRNGFLTVQSQSFKVNVNLGEFYLACLQIISTDASATRLPPGLEGNLPAE